ncbi:hypothetical protein K2O51_31825 (plasmid) [Cupriavidus pinatubonensis]|uniref:hypothetical protein n=1 Tax=Cupriavidus pinatubonensis TaxID=248026 RepID=UPI001C731FA6|nr:hypothetical protein [Cupriavidus pinatubonensis]QYY33616.1 hypothetical protein K2O51_31825 [Cupriavidus pinatubonensis]
MTEFDTRRPVTPLGAIQRGPSCGLVIFDDPQERRAGTAYLPEALPQRIRSMNDLRTDMVWVANVPDRDISSAHPGLRATDYFGASLADIAYDLGLSYSRGYPLTAQEGVAVATILSRAMTIALRTYGWDADGSEASFEGDTLAEEIATGMRLRPAVVASGDAMASRLGHATQDRSVPNWPFEQHDAVVPVTLRFNRLAYARQLLAQEVPAGTDWVEISKAPRVGGLPAIANVSIDWSDADPDLAALAAFGQTGKRKQQLRLWASGPELAWLSRICRPSVSTAWINANGYVGLPAELKLPVPLAVRSQLTMSYAAGLVGYSHLRAVLSIECSQGSKGRAASAIGAWLHAYDRGLMFSVARRAHESGFHVRWYGNGEIRLSVREDQIDALTAFRLEEGFMYPAVASLELGTQSASADEEWSTGVTEATYGTESAG